MDKASAKHPRSLHIFFSTEMWERYGFYVVQSLLALFLALHFKWQDSAVYALVGSFTALTYISPIFGGFIADRLLGQKQSIFWGGAVLFISYLSLAMMSSDHGLIASLAGIAVGTGLFKPNISSLLGNEYPQSSSQRENGFTIFYMGITSGIILGTTLPNLLNHRFGWSVAFVSAAIGMLIGVAIFSFGIVRYHIKDYCHQTFHIKKVLLALGLMALLWTLSFYILNVPSIANTVFIAIVAASAWYFVYTIKKEDRIQARKTTAIALLCIISVLFWALYFQMFMSITLFIARAVKPVFLGIQFPAPYFVSIQSLGAIVFGALITRRKQDTTQRSMQTGNKFMLSMLFMTMAFATITAACYFSHSTQFISPGYIIPAYLMISLAELFLYPVGLSAVTVLASHTKVSTLMGMFFVSLGLGGFLSGKLALLTAIPEGEMSLALLKAHYALSFSKLLLILMVAMMVCAGLNRCIKRLLAADASCDASRQHRNVHERVAS